MAGIDRIRNFHRKVRDKRIIKRINDLMIEESSKEKETAILYNKLERELEMIPNDWQEKIERDPERDPFYLILEEKFTLKSVYLETEKYCDSYPRLGLRRQLFFIRKYCEFFLKKKKIKKEKKKKTLKKFFFKYSKKIFFFVAEFY